MTYNHSALNPVRVEVRQEYGLTVHYIQGLNIFLVNDVNSKCDPRIRFFETLANRSDCSAHVGTDALEGDTPEEIFGTSVSTTEYEVMSVGLLLGSYYQNTSDDLGLFFPQALHFLRGASTSDLDYIVQRDAAAIYVRPQAPEAAAAVLRTPFQDHETWLTTMAALYEMVVLSGGDGWMLEVYTRAQLPQERLDDMLADSIACITSSEWFQRNHSRMVWDPTETCLSLNPRPPRQ